MLFRLFSRHISRTQSFQEYRHFLFQVRVVLNTLVSLMGRLEPCNARIAADRRTDTDCKPSLRMRPPRMRPPRELITIRGLHRPLVLIYNMDEIAERYDRVHRNYQGKDGKELIAKLSLQEGCSVLDLGCGTGYLTSLLAQRVGQRGTGSGRGEDCRCQSKLRFVEKRHVSSRQQRRVSERSLRCHLRQSRHALDKRQRESV